MSCILVSHYPFKEERTMRKALLSLTFILLLLPAAGLLSANAANTVDGLPATAESSDLPANTAMRSGGKAVDTLGDLSNSGSGSGRAKGNSYQIDIDVTLVEAEFWLDFSDTQTLIFYVFMCPDEFGTYTEVYRNSESVVGSGAGWYTSGAISVDMDAGDHYIIVVSWDGYMTYFYDTGDSQVTSFGYQTHGYATGYHPLPASFSSMVNDSAIYHQRLNTVENTSLEMTTWGTVKAAF